LSKTVLEAINLTKSYGEITALDGLSVSFKEGGTGLLGPNGAGKTTLLKIASGLLLPTDGLCNVLGKDIVMDPVFIKERIGFMPDYDCLIPELTGVQFISYMGQISGMKKAVSIQRAHEVLNYIRMGDERYRKISSYSQGMKQKIKLGQALVHNPDILFLDEPTLGLDPLSRNEMLELIKHLANESKKSIILSTHILPDVEYVCKNVVVINEGTLVVDGSLENLVYKDVGFIVVKIKGNEGMFKKKIKEMGYEIEEKLNEIRVLSGDPKTIDDVMIAANAAETQIRFVRRGIKTLEEVFTEVLIAEKNKGGAKTG
jgi:ABC-2 type transport system ATP-binding protein